jgi:hypothetical protein
MDDRARITLPNVMLWLMAMAFLAAFMPAFSDGLSAAVGQTIPGTLLLFRVLPGLAVVVLLTVIWRKATAGVS